VYSTHIRHFLFFFGTRTRLAIKFGCWISLTKMAMSLDSSSPLAQCFSLLRCHMPCLISLELGLMLRVCSVTSQEMPRISARLHANMSLLWQRKLMSSLFYLGFKPTPIGMVLVGSSALICMALVSLAALKAPNDGGMAGPSNAYGTQKLSSLNSTVATAAVANSMMSCSQSSAR
jgi:hypothetical protein